MSRPIQYCILQFLQTSPWNSLDMIFNFLRIIIISIIIVIIIVMLIRFSRLRIKNTASKSYVVIFTKVSKNGIPILINIFVYEGRLHCSLPP